MIVQTPGSTTIKDQVTGAQATVDQKLTGEFGVHTISSIDSIGGKTWPVLTRVDVDNLNISASGFSDAFSADGMGCINVNLSISNPLGADPLILVEIEGSDDQANWNRFYSLSRSGIASFHRAFAIRLASVYYRFKYTLFGTTPSFDITINTSLKPYLPDRNIVLTNFNDLDLSTVNNVSSSFFAADLKNVFAQIIRPNDTGNNATVVIQASVDNQTWIDVTGNITIANDSSVLTTFSNVAYRFYRIRVKTAAALATSSDVFWGGNA